MLIKPLQQVCELIESPEIEQRLNMYTAMEQEEIFQMMRGILEDEIHFVLEVYNRFEMGGRTFN